MKPMTTYTKWYGRDVPPSPIYKLTAGNLSLEFQDGDLRYARLGQVELVRRIYMAVRDVNWNTIPGHISGLTVKQSATNFRVGYRAVHQNQDVHFEWQATLEGQPDGTITFTMDGVARADFRYCRIGFCVLHPIQGMAGRPYHAQTPGGEISGQLPELIAPQRIEGGFEVPIFPACSHLSIEQADGIQVVTRFEGDLFETEDQRNWTDGSFKTYCTPLSLGYPHSAQPGQRFHQTVTLYARDLRPHAATPVADRPVSLFVGSPNGVKLPRLGFELPAEASELSPAQAEELSALSPEHLKVNIHLADPAWAVQLEAATAQSALLRCPLEIALFLNDEPEEALHRLARALEGAQLARVIVFTEQEAAVGSTSLAAFHQARQVLQPRLHPVSWIGGTNGNFAEVNRQPPEASAMDGVAYPINPQVHMADERSLVEALGAQKDTLLTARAWSQGQPVHVSAVTLKPPFNQAAQEEEKPLAADQLPANVDARQMSLFAAAWTVGSLASLADGAAHSITYYETIGWRGLIERPGGCALPAQFPSQPGMIFPVYWVFHFLAETKSGFVQPMRASHPLQLGGLAVHKEGQTYWLVANYLPHEQEICAHGCPPGAASIRRLNQDTFYQAAWEPSAFSQASQPLPNNGQGEINLRVKAYETAMIKFEGTRER
jgi:hypothetical protein